MRQYIINLTNHLITKNRYYDYPLDADFIKQVTIELETVEVSEMRPEKLGEIMCSFEVGDVWADRNELFKALHFAGDCEGMLRELVALCLAYVIRARLDPNNAAPIPPYNRLYVTTTN